MMGLCTLRRHTSFPLRVWLLQPNAGASLHALIPPSAIPRPHFKCQDLLYVIPGNYDLLDCSSLQMPEQLEGAPAARGLLTPAGRSGGCGNTSLGA